MLNTNTFRKILQSLLFYVLLRAYAIMNEAHKNRLTPSPRRHYNIKALSKKWCGFHDLGKADQCIYLVLGQEV